MLTQTILNFTKSKIATMEYAPGAAFSESDLRAAFNAPKNLIKEVVLRLALDKMIHMNPQGNASVSKLNLATTLNSLFIINSLLTAIVNETNGEQIKNLHEIAALQKACLDAANKTTLSSREFFNLSDEFYFALPKLINFPRVATIVFDEKLHIERMLRLHPENQTCYRTIISLYARILGAMENAQSEAAINAIHEFADILKEQTFLATLDYPELFEAEANYPAGATSNA